MNIPVDISNTILKTERLVLRPFRESDLDDFYEYAKVDGVGQMAGWTPHKDKQETAKILKSFIAKKRTFAIEKDGKVIGSFGIDNYDEDDLPELKYIRAQELGCIVSKDFWGQGIAKETTEAVIDYLFNTLDVEFLVLGHISWNNQSARVQDKMGVQYFKETEYKTKYGTTEKNIYGALINPKYKDTIKIENLLQDKSVSK